MATYPAYTQLVGTTKLVQSGRSLTRAASGKPRFQQLYPTARVSFSVRHELLVSDLSTYETFVATNLNISFDFVYSMDAQTYTCQFDEVPVYSSANGLYTTVTAKLVVV